MSMTDTKPPTATGRPEATGLFFGLTAYAMWGLMPLYVWAVATLNPLELMAHRIVWSLLSLLALVLLLGKGRQALEYLRDRRSVRFLALSTVLIGINWGVFLYAVVTERVLQTSLGYFIGPLVSVGLGVLVLGERLRRAQKIALCLAIIGVAVPVLHGGVLPWIALTLAFAFGIYGLVRKRAGVDGLTGTWIEQLFMLPAGLAFFLWVGTGEGLSFGQHGWRWDLLLIASGPVTAAPLVCYVVAVRAVRLSTMGFMQYLAPSMSFLLAVLVLGEPFTRVEQICFGLIWTALAIFSYDLASHHRRGRRLSVSGPVVTRSRRSPAGCPRP